MKKDAYYFPHDVNAKDDPKCVLLIEQLGLEGYGIFWMLIEILREQPDYTYPISLLPALARRYNTTAEKIKAVVISYDLFSVADDRVFFSESLNRRMQEVNIKRKLLSEAGKKGNAKRWELSQNKEDNSHIIATRSQSDNHPIAIKEKESKLNNSNICANAHAANAVCDDDFEKFWDLYDKKRNRDKCSKKWKTLSVSDREAAIAYIPNYKRSQPNKLYRKDPLSFLNQRAWNDELIFKDTQNEQTNTAYKI